MSVVTLERWPYGKRGAFALTVDDIHPESSKNSDRLDYSGDMDSGNFKYLEYVLQLCPQPCTDIFVVADWLWRSNHPTPLRRGPLKVLGDLIVNKVRNLGCIPYFSRKLFRRTTYYFEHPFRLDLPQHKDWIKWLLSKIENYKLEVAPHGLYHYNPSAEFHSMEFEGLSKSECIKRLARAEEILQSAGIPFVKGFRPPGWCLTKNLLYALQTLGYIFCACSADFRTRIDVDAKSNGAGLKGCPLILPSFLDSSSIVAFCANVNVHTPDRALQILQKGGLAIMQTHVVSSTYGLTALSNEFVKTFSRLIKAIHYYWPSDIWFTTLKNIAIFYIAKSLTTIKLEKEGARRARLTLFNRSPYFANGLTLRLQDAYMISDAKIRDHSVPFSIHNQNMIIIDVPPNSLITIEMLIG